jgi:hypothetical protein
VAEWFKAPRFGAVHRQLCRRFESFPSPPPSRTNRLNVCYVAAKPRRIQRTIATQPHTISQPNPTVATLATKAVIATLSKVRSGLRCVSSYCWASRDTHSGMNLSHRASTLSCWRGSSVLYFSIVRWLKQYARAYPSARADGCVSPQYKTKKPKPKNQITDKTTRNAPNRASQLGLTTLERVVLTYSSLMR